MAKSLIATSPFTPGMQQLSAGTLEAMRLEAIRTSGLPGPPHDDQGDESWLGLISPGEEEDYSDERYWVYRCRITNAAGTSAAQLTIEALPDTDPRYLHVTATNLSELVDHTHNLDTGTYVWVERRRDQQGPGVPHYFFSYRSVATGSPWASFASTTQVHETGGPAAGANCRIVGAETYDQQARVFYAFDLDESGDAVGHAAGELSVAFTHAAGEIFKVDQDTAASVYQTYSDVYLALISESFTPGDITWEDQPAWSWLSGDPYRRLTACAQGIEGVYGEWWFNGPLAWLEVDTSGETFGVMIGCYGTYTGYTCEVRIGANNPAGRFMWA